MEQSRQLNATNWVNNYGDALYAYTLARVNSQPQAEDIVQETFLSAWRARDTYNGLASEKNWLYTICKNKIIDHYRKVATNREVLSSIDENVDNFFVEDGHWSQESKPKEWGLDYSKSIESKEFYTILGKCKNKLKEMQESVFTMKYLEDIDTNDICETLGITVQNYWILIHRAKIQLRNCLEKNWIKV